ncbi:DEAD/DEAH box helicase family protein [Bartonella krasnovii]|uniref:N-6 DNA methylase n=1 Tax=Bartonella krasnovii TaxID=2267275 RepID=A0A5B9D0D3_9HYPH|nr:type ISP restriction/modification enzyme [Bartonella krasnovii]QEE11938.1 N-6 DNA methylase [Bartonella krasnovii]UNF42755.1 DEAD/DEAH box helicase family protein [Bartonella krasnovii]UNF54252.1 DEAD/DEAH box helicase family protein [Bartonella krasnovii]UNF55965.1 DEAD/DEAH box helicase family protein [Bartonella krasnovii]
MLQSVKSDNKKVTLRSLLEFYREKAKSPRELGTLFENLVKDYFSEDPLQKQEYEKVQTYLEWAEEHDEDGRDIGIDLVATIRDQGGYAAIQCKCYDASHIIKKEDIDSFIAASGKKIFTRRILVDSTESNWSDNANNTCDGQEVRIQQINLFDLENSQIDWGAYKERGQAVLKEQPKKKLLDHQTEALERVCEGLQEADRGKLIMACGTGKTFTSLKIAEQIAGKGKRVLFLVPSLALMSQTIREWTIDTEVPLRSFAVCSDTQVGKRRKSKHDDESGLDASDLVLPATTNSQELARKANKISLDVMTVIFSTYHSIQVISDAQKEYDLPEFDLIICDEAHRTTGIVLGTDKHESEFIKVHDNSIILGKKRLYMTATPKIFADSAKKQAHEMNGILASMDDEALYGKELYTYTFSKAVNNELLVPYKIIVLGVNEEEVSESIQHLMTDENYELTLDDKTKIIGCYQALSKIDLKVDLSDDPNPMRRALAFCRDIKTSERICDTFNSKGMQEELLDLHKLYKETPPLQCTFAHIDGTQSAKKRNEALDWLKEDAGENTCRVLTNVRCLSEGVDVPALDAIMFLHPRKSQVDVIQAVGRIMRRSKGKKRGYIILPVGVPAGISAEEALKYNKRYSVVWQVINALLSHDENFEVTLNQMILGQDVSHTLEIAALKSMTTVEDKLHVYEKPESAGLDIGKAAYEPQKYIHSVTGRLPFYKEFPNALKTLLAKKFTLADYWGIWAGNVAEIAQNHINRLKDILSDKTSEAYHAFESFHKELKNNLNSEIKQEEALEMLAQHLVTRPVFEALFDGNEFVQNNSISQAMEKILAELDKTNIKQVSKELQEFYDSVKFRASGITSPQARQNLIIKLYEDFFAKAFKKTTDRLGIVYTPIEVVDFIIHSVDDVLRNEFGKSLGSRGVSILDPFTGTGTFITRLLQSNLIKPEDMEYKFRYDIHANEIVLLAYYIAAINIEATYHSLMKGEYIPFKHIGLTDTFRMLEEKSLLQELFKENSEYLEHQKKLDIKVIFGNPPYSTKQKNENDNAKNTPYPILDKRISKTYAAHSKATNMQALYDSYIRAIRWASDRINNAGVIGFVTNAGFITGHSMDSLRKCLVEEFSSLYIFHLRGNQRTSGELSRKEGGKIFGSGSRAPIAISILVKNPESQQCGKIYFRDIGDYLTRKEKLTIIESLGSIDGITRSKQGWKIIKPDRHNDWLGQRNESFETFLAIGVKKGHGKKLFESFSRGIMTSRDAWVYNSSREALAKNMNNMIAFYNSEVERFNDAYSYADQKLRVNSAHDFVNSDEKKISWSHNLKRDLVKEKTFNFERHCLMQSLYRPFTKQWLYYNQALNDGVYQMPRIFPIGRTVENRVIQITGIGAKKDFSALMTKTVPDLNVIDGGSQCFPRYIYEDTTVLKSKSGKQSHLFANATEQNKTTGLQRRDAITDEGLAHFKAAYPNETIIKDDLFYYVYGLLYSEDYRTRYADNLSKELPRIPCVKTAEDFWKFVTAGRELGHLHVNYEDVEPYPVSFKKSNPKQTDISNPEKFYYVTEMKFAKIKNSKEKDKTTVIYNSNITMTDIPKEAYEYIVNGKPALEWVMERQCVKTNKKSGIVNDANRYAVETVGNPAYPLELFQRVITVSLETMKIVKNLPKLEIRETE